MGSTSTNGWLLAQNADVDHFRVIRPLGRGSTAEVYLARDMKLGRKVALKLIKPEALGADSPLDRFLQEAQATARFSHPNIINIYSVGELDGKPYLALEYLAGQSLRARLQEEKPALTETIRIAAAIADALTVAHADGVLHRDLKPENVIMPKDGRPRVLDFGLAAYFQPDAETPGGTEESSLRGTPAYMAPEQWRGEQTSGVTDVWALGVILYEMIAGLRPVEEDSLVAQAEKVSSATAVEPVTTWTEVRKDLSDLISRCLEKDPADRPSAGEAAQFLRRMLVSDREAPSDEESPFRGLLPFHEQHRHLFFGREAEVASITERLRTQPVIPIVGPSGAGKSSLVQAGLIPRLRERGPLVVLQCRPGSDPFRALASRITQTRRQATRPDPTGDYSDTDRLAMQLKDSPTLLNIMLQRLADRRNATVLLFVDQLEELATLVEDEETRQAFMQAICTAADDPEMPARVVFTLREEFLSRLAKSPEVREALGHVTVLQPPGPEALADILTEPLKLVGYDYDDPDLFQDMVTEVEGEASSLPLLQFAGSMLWSRRDKGKRLLRRKAYQSMGGVAGALAKHADGILSGMSVDEVSDARSIMLRLVTDVGTRRIQTRSALLDGLDSGAQDVLSRLVHSRLITARQADDGSKAELELTHESLVVTWSRLRRWIEESKEELVFLNEISQAAELWQKRGNRDEEAWHGDALREAEKAIKHVSTNVTTLVKDFLQACRRKEKRRIWFRRGIVAAIMALLATIAVVFIVKEQDAREQRDKAQQRQAQALRLNAQSAFEQGDPLTARATLREALEIEDAPTARALWWRLSQEPAVWQSNSREGSWPAFSPDGREIAATEDNGRVVLYDAFTGEQKRVIQHTVKLGDTVYSPDGNLRAIGAFDGAVLLYLRETGELIRSWPGEGRLAGSAGFSPSGKRLAIPKQDHTIAIADIETGAIVGTVRKAAAEIQPGKKRAEQDSFVGENHILARDTHWERKDRARVGLFSIQSGLFEKELVRWNPAETFDFDMHHVWGEGHGLLALWEPGGELRLHDRRTGELRHSLKIDRPNIPHYALSLDPTGRYLHALNESGLQRWDLKTKTHLGTRPGGEFFNCAVSPLDGALVAERKQGFELIRPDRIPRPSNRRDLLGLARVAKVFGTKGEKLVVLHDDGSFSLWDTRSASYLGELLGGQKTPDLSRFDISLDGKLISTDNKGQVFHADSGKVAVTLQEAQHVLGSLHFHPDGRVITITGTGKGPEIWLWSPQTGEVVQKVSLGGSRPLLASPSVWALGNANGDLEILSLETGKIERVLPDLADDASTQGGPFKTAELSTFGKHLGVFKEDKIWVMELATGQTREFRYQDFGWTGDQPRGRLQKFWLPRGGNKILVAYTEREDAFAVWDLEKRKIAAGPVTLGATGKEAEFLRAVEGGFMAITGIAADAEALSLYDVNSGRPLWHGPILLSEGPSLLTHQGWYEFESSKTQDPGEQGPPEWQDMTKNARLSREDPAGRSLCVLRWDDRLENFSLPQRKLTFTTHAKDIRNLEATSDGCVTRSGSGVTKLWKSAKETTEFTASGARALFVDKTTIGVATQKHLLNFNHNGQAKDHQPLEGQDLSALHIAQDLQIAGYNDGRVILRGKKPSTPPIAFRDMTSSPVVRIIQGPTGTIVVGHQNGTVGIWQLSTGAKLHSEQLHGSAVHLLLKRQKLYAASDLGDHLVWDLQHFYLDYCPLLQSVWDEVQVAIEGGNVVVRKPPDGHRCWKAKQGAKKEEGS